MSKRGATKRGSIPGSGAMSVAVQAQGDDINKGPSVHLSGKDLDGDQQRYPRSAAEHCQGQEAMGGDVMVFGLKAHSAKDFCLFFQGSGDECASVQLLYSSDIIEETHGPT
jgi:hypothetical protein